MPVQLWERALNRFWGPFTQQATECCHSCCGCCFGSVLSSTLHASWKFVSGTDGFQGGLDGHISPLVLHLPSISMLGDPNGAGNFTTTSCLWSASENLWPANPAATMISALWCTQKGDCTSLRFDGYGTGGLQAPNFFQSLRGVGVDLRKIPPDNGCACGPFRAVFSGVTTAFDNGQILASYNVTITP